MGEVMGYGRVSSNTQSLDIQTDALTRAGCKRIYSEKFTSTALAGGPSLPRCWTMSAKGTFWSSPDWTGSHASSLTCCRSRSSSKKRASSFVVWIRPIDTTTPEGRMTYQILRVIAEFENSLRRARQIEGIAAAKRRIQWPVPGPSSCQSSAPTLDPAVIAHGSKAAAAKALGISRDSVYRVSAGAEAA